MKSMSVSAASDDEVTSPRPGIVKSMRDLFENPKNFEWTEATKVGKAKTNFFLRVPTMNVTT